MINRSLPFSRGVSVKATGTVEGSETWHIMNNQQLITFLLHITFELVQEIILPWCQLTTYNVDTRDSITDALSRFFSTFKCEYQYISATKRDVMWLRAFCSLLTVLVDYGRVGLGFL